MNVLKRKNLVQSTKKIKKEKKKLTKIDIFFKVLNIVVNLFLLLSIIFFCLTIYTMNKYKSNPTETNIFGYKPLYMSVDTMSPTIPMDSISIVKKVKYDEIINGDIIVYKIEGDDGKLITHRVVEKTEEGLKTKADTSEIIDSYVVKSNNIKGKVVYVATFTSVLIPLIKTKEGLFFYVGVPIIVFIFIYLIVSIFKYSKIRKEREERLKEKNKKEKEIHLSNYLNVKVNKFKGKSFNESDLPSLQIKELSKCLSENISKIELEK